jgi:hypothetical protein
MQKCNRLFLERLILSAPAHKLPAFYKTQYSLSCHDIPPVVDIGSYLILFISNTIYIFLHASSRMKGTYEI